MYFFAQNKIPAPNIKRLQVEGSGVIPMSKPQLTTVLCPPLEKSATKSVQVPFGLVASNDCKVAVGGVVSNSDGSDCGSMLRPSDDQVPVSCPSAFKE